MEAKCNNTEPELTMTASALLGPAFLGAHILQRLNTLFADNLKKRPHPYIFDEKRIPPDCAPYVSFEIGFGLSNPCPIWSELLAVWSDLHRFISK